MSESDDCLTIPGRGVIYNDVVGAPPFAPRPYYNSDGDKVCRTSTSTGRSVTVTVATASSNQATLGSTSKTCNIHEICYYCQVFIFISAIITGFALVIAGAFMHSQHGELVVFVYIGGLLMCVNSALLAIQCFVRKKQKSRLRCYTSSSRHVNSSVQGSTLVIGNQQYIPISSMNGMPPSLPSLRGAVPPNVDNGLISLESNARASPVHFSSPNSPIVPPQSPHSPTHCDLQIKYLSPTHSAISYKQNVSHQGHVLHHHHHHHHHQQRDKPRFHSPPLGIPVSQQNPTTSISNQHGNRVVNPRDDWISSNYNESMTPKKSSGFRDGNSSAVHIL